MGEFKKGNYEGKGEYFYSSGKRYEGEFQNNLTAHMLMNMDLRGHMYYIFYNSD